MQQVSGSSPDKTRKVGVNELLMARQPIFDRHGRLFGYELLYRSDHPLEARIFDGDAATSKLLVNLFTSVSDYRTKLGKPLFVNFTTKLLQSDALHLLHPRRIFLEILEGQEVTGELLDALKELKGKGYKLVLDDYDFNPEYDPLLEYASIIKVDVLATYPSRYFKQIRALREKGIKLLAEKIEDQATHDFCHMMGFNFFQGYYLAHPEPVKGKAISANLQLAMELVHALRDENISIDKVTHLVSRDPNLSYQLLKVLNSPLCAMRRKVTSVREAIVYLGLDQVKKWTFLVSMVSSSQQPTELFRMLLTRAYTCESLSRASGEVNQSDHEAHFTAGLLSGIDELVGADMEKTLHGIALDDSIIDAIQRHEGKIGKRLKMVLALEHNRWQELGQLHVSHQRLLCRAFGEGILWANGILESIK